MKNKDPKYIVKSYLSGCSTSEIAKELGEFPNTIRRVLLKNGVKLRDKSDAQKLYLKDHEHPMTGKVRTAEEKEKISNALMNQWDNLPEEEKARRVKRLSKSAKKNWNSLSDDGKADAIDKMNAARIKTARTGSKNENKIAELLSERGYKLYRRTKEYTPGNEFEIDICMPGLKIAIEVDGRSHYDPIYGDKAFDKKQQEDGFKNRFLISNGWTLIRLVDKTTSHSRAACVRAVEGALVIIGNDKLHGKLHYVDLK